MGYRRAARLGSWDEPLNFDLHLNLNGEPRIPFAPQLKPNSNPVGGPASFQTQFPQFVRLPSELQHHILSFCDKPTLYKLMQVSYTRQDAAKQFWSDPDTWYCIQGVWIDRGGNADMTHHDVNSLACVERVNIEYDLLESDSYLKHDNCTEFDNSFGDKIRQFWQILQKLCPRLTHVLLTTKASAQDTWDSPKTFYKEFLQLCPAGINSCLSLGQGEGPSGSANYKPRMERSLWRLVDNRAKTSEETNRYSLEKVRTDWTPRCVLLPANASQGRRGDACRMLYRFHRLAFQEYATQILLIDAIERHHFHGKNEPFECFNEDCVVRFHEPGEYFLHSIETRHDGIATPPEDFKELFAEQAQKLGLLAQQSNWVEHFDQAEDIDRIRAIQRCMAL